MTSLPLHPVDLEPSLVGYRTYTTRRRYSRIDSTALMSLQICLLCLFPAEMIVPSLTYIGRPALVIGLFLWFWWIIVRFNPRLTMVGRQPLRWAVLFLIVSTLLSYAAGVLRGEPRLEADGSNLALLGIAEFTGVILMAADGIPNWERLHGLLRVYVWCAAYMGVIGLIQFALGRDITQYLVLPGLQMKGDLAGFQSRGGDGLFRVASTASHYIEFSSLMAIALPFGVHFARFAATRLQRQLFGVAAVLIAAAIPVTLSRTGVVAVGVSLVVLVPVWNWRMRYNMMLIATGLLAAMIVVKPGLLGTLYSLFTNAGTDPSIKGRTDDYADVARYFAQRPWLGRGPGTFIPILYRILDNQWLGTLVSTGLVGVAALAVLHLTCITLAGVALRRSTRAADRHLCAALISAQFIAMAVAATFDSMGFSTYATILALMMGLCGTVWRFTHPTALVRTSAVRRGAAV